MTTQQIEALDQYSLAVKALGWLTEAFANCIVLSDSEFNAGYYEAVLEVWEMLGKDDQDILFTAEEREVAERLRVWLDTRAEAEKGDDAEG